MCVVEAPVSSAVGSSVEEVVVAAETEVLGSSDGSPATVVR